MKRTVSHGPAREGGRATSRDVFEERSCEGTTDPVATRLAACGLGSFSRRRSHAAWLHKTCRRRTPPACARGPRVGAGPAMASAVEERRRGRPEPTRGPDCAGCESSDPVEGRCESGCGSRATRRSFRVSRSARREAIVRITDASSARKDYASGGLCRGRGPSSGDTAAPRVGSPRGSGATEVQLKCYDRGGRRQRRRPPLEPGDHSPIGFRRRRRGEPRRRSAQGTPQPAPGQHWRRPPGWRRQRVPRR